MTRTNYGLFKLSISVAKSTSFLLLLPESKSILEPQGLAVDSLEAQQQKVSQRLCQVMTRLSSANH